MFAHPMEALEEVAETEERRDGLPQEEVLKGFWKTVVVLNVALLSLSLGVMLAYFERSPYSVALVGLGVFSSARAWRMYRKYAPSEEQ